MARRGGWRRAGRGRPFRYLDARGKRITDPAKLERLELLRIPPAWRGVWISPNPKAKLQATGIDSAGRRQYVYHSDFRAQREQEKFDKLVRFAAHLPQLRETMAEHMELDSLAPERVCAIAVRLINLGWFRVGSERYVRSSRTYGITTLTKQHVEVSGKRIKFSFRGKAKSRIRAAVVDSELADAVRQLRALEGGSRLFRYRRNGDVYCLSAAMLNEYISTYLGAEFTAKDFRTWSGTPAGCDRARRARSSGERDRGQTRDCRRDPARRRSTWKHAGGRARIVCQPGGRRAVSRGPQLNDFRPRHLRVVGARELGLNPEERALLSLLRSWRIRRARLAA